MTQSTQRAGPLSQRQVFDTWWPLAASWILMGLELPAVSAFMARLPHPTVSLAAYGGVVFPISLFIEAPIIMFLAASTALSKDRASYLLVRRIMWIGGLSFTALHALVAFTPLYDLVAGHILGAPAEILEPARRGLQIMTPFTISVAYRRFQQGVMIRFGHSRVVGLGTVIRLSTILLVLGVGYAVHSLPGIVVGPLAVASGVVAEAIFAGWMVRPVVRGDLARARVLQVPLTVPAFSRFYVPLAATAVLTMLLFPLASAAMGRMPRTIDSLAAWPVVGGLLFTLRSVGFALNEVVVALLERPGATIALRRFALRLATITSTILLVLAATPLSRIWFEGVSGLSPGLAALARTGLWISFLMPGLTALQSWYQGLLLYGHRTRAIAESVLVLLGVLTVLLVAGVAVGRFPGLYVSLAAMMVAAAAQVSWLWVRGRVVLSALEVEEPVVAHGQPSLDAKTTSAAG